MFRPKYCSCKNHVLCTLTQLNKSLFCRLFSRHDFYPIYFMPNCPYNNNNNSNNSKKQQQQQKNMLGKNLFCRQTYLQFLFTYEFFAMQDIFEVLAMLNVIATTTTTLRSTNCVYFSGKKINDNWTADTNAVAKDKVTCRVYQAFGLSLGKGPLLVIYKWNQQLKFKIKLSS